MTDEMKARYEASKMVEQAVLASPVTLAQLEAEEAARSSALSASSGERVQLNHAIAATVALPTNLDDAVAIVDRIDRVRAVQRELKAAFARSELDGGAKAAVDHPLYREAAAKLEELHDEMMGLI